MLRSGIRRALVIITTTFFFSLGPFRGRQIASRAQMEMCVVHVVFRFASSGIKWIHKSRSAAGLVVMAPPTLLRNNLAISLSLSLMHKKGI